MSAPESFSPLLRSSARRHRLALPTLAVLSAFGWVASHVHHQNLYSPFRWAVYAAIGGPVVFVAAYADDRATLVRGVFSGVLAAAAYFVSFFLLGEAPGAYECVGATAFGTTLFVAYLAARKTGVEKADARSVLFASLAITLVTPASLGVLFETLFLLPKSWDHAAFAMDATLPIHAFHVGRFLEANAVARSLAKLTYDGIFVLLPLLYGLQIRRRESPPTDLLTAVVFVTLVGQIGYYLLPVVGPAYAFPNQFPDFPPAPASLSLAPATALPDLRNCMPSVHTALALVFLWNTRGFSLAVRALGAFVLAFTVLSTLGFGYHYAVDLVAATPFAAAVQIGCTAVDPAHARVRCRAFFSTASLAALAILSPRFVTRSALAVPGLVPAAALAVVIASVLCERQVARSAVARALPTDSDLEAPFGARTLALGFSLGLFVFPIFRSLEVTFGGDSAVLPASAIAASAAAFWMLTTPFGALRPVRYFLRSKYVALGLLAPIFVAKAILPILPQAYRVVGSGAAAGSLRSGLAVFVVTLLVAVPLACALTASAGLLLGFAAGGKSDATDESGAAGPTPSVRAGLGPLSFGGAAGACASAYVFIPAFGVSDSLIAPAAVVLALFLVAFVGARTRGSSEPPSHRASSPGSASRFVGFAAAAASILVARTAIVDALGPSVVTSDRRLLFGFAPVLVAIGLGALLGPRAAGAVRRRAPFAGALIIALWIWLLPTLAGSTPSYLESAFASAMNPTRSDHEWIRFLLSFGFGVPFGVALWGASCQTHLEQEGFSLRRYGFALLGGAICGECAGLLAGHGASSPLLFGALALGLVALLCSAPRPRDGRAELARPLRGRTQLGFLFAAIACASGIHLLRLGPAIRAAATPGAHAPRGAAIDSLATLRDALRVSPAARVLWIGSVSNAAARPLLESTEAAREFLLRADRLYGAIGVAPSSPAQDGASLFSSDFYSLVRDHLDRGGTFRQTLRDAELRPSDLECVGVTLRHVFSTVQLDRGNRAVTFFASNGPPSVSSVGPAILPSANVDRWLETAANAVGGASELVTTDDNLLIEQAAVGGSIEPDFPGSLFRRIGEYATK